MARVLGAVIVGALLSLIAAPSAWAHTRAGTATDWVSRLTSVPEVPGVSWKLYPTGEYIEASNASDRVVTIFGYEGEPYLRIGPAGVERNANSPSTYLDARRDGDVALPPRADAGSPPEWVRISDEPRHAWFDHRVHRMPDDGRPETWTWTIPFEMGDRRYEVAGRVRRSAGPIWWTWIALGGLATAAALLGLRREGLRARIRPAAIVISVVAVSNLVLHLPDEFLALPVSGFDRAYGVFHNVLFVGTGLMGAWVAVRRSPPSLLALGIGSGAIAFHQGFLQVQQLAGAELATVWPPAAIRLAVGASVAQFLWVMALIGATVAGRDRDRPASSGSTEGLGTPERSVAGAA